MVNTLWDKFVEVEGKDPEELIKIVDLIKFIKFFMSKLLLKDEFSVPLNFGTIKSSTGTLIDSAAELRLSDETYMFDLFKDIVPTGDTDDIEEESEDSNDDFQYKRRRKNSFESENSHFETNQTMHASFAEFNQPFKIEDRCQSPAVVINKNEKINHGKQEKSRKEIELE